MEVERNQKPTLGAKTGGFQVIGTCLRGLIGAWGPGAHRETRGGRRRVGLVLVFGFLVFGLHGVLCTAYSGG